jgi:lysophospholipase L1-like esterase
MCGAVQAFLSQSTDKNKFEIKEALMPDSMHPSSVGMRIIATRLEPLIASLLTSPPGQELGDTLSVS